MTEQAAAAGAIATSAPDSTALAREEIKRAVRGARVLAELGEGVLLVGPEGSYRPLVEAWRRSPPIFVRHLCPVQRAEASLQATDAIDALRAAALDLADRIEPALPFSVQTRILSPQPLGPYEVNVALSEALSARTGAPLDVRHPEQVLSVVIAGHEGEETAFLGVSPVADNLSAWAGGARRFAREEGQISRAEFKLLEALEVFAVTLPPRGLALDLGAAPGGWTRVARVHGLRVIAVDPADLAPALRADHGVRHVHTTAEAYLAAGPERFALILNDMRMDARDSARLMVAYARTLEPGGLAIMTLKLPEHGQRVVVDRALGILREGYEILGARQLFHNRSEITVALTPRGA